MKYLLLLLCLIWHVENFGNLFENGEKEAIARANELSCRPEVVKISVFPLDREGDLRYKVIWAEEKK